MQNVRINGVNINVHGDADIHVDSYGNVNITVKPKIIFKYNENNWQKPVPMKHWLHK